MRISSSVSSSIGSLQREYETIANNLANVSSNGYKRVVNSFSKKLSELQGDDPTPEASGSIKSKTMIDYSQGDLVETGRKLDVTICGSGFFVLETKNGPVYSRNGHFNLNSTGQLVDSAGRLVAGVSGPIVIPKDVPLSDISISNDGNVNVDGDNFGKIKVVDFPNNYQNLRPAGSGTFTIDKKIYPTTIQTPLVKQGFREASNVNITEELVAMLDVTRMYEANMKVLTKQNEDDRLILSVAMG